MERNYYKFVKPASQIDYAKLAQSMSGMFQFDTNSIPATQSGYSIQDDKNYAWEAPKHTYTSQAQQTQAHNSVWNGVATAAVQGMLEGVIGGTERLVNGLSGGVYGNVVDNLTEGSFSNRQNNLQNRADQAGIGYVNRLANSAIDVSSATLRDLYGIKYGGKVAKKFFK